MRYWDSSALVPLVIDESSSALTRRWLNEDKDVVTWIWTRTEIISAIERRVRQGLLSHAQRRIAVDSLDAFASEWNEVNEVLAVRSRANALLGRHPLRAAGAGQLAAAVLTRSQLASELEFASLDEKLSMAAEREGLRLPRPTG